MRRMFSPFCRFVKSLVFVQLWKSLLKRNCLFTRKQHQPGFLSVGSLCETSNFQQLPATWTGPPTSVPFNQSCCPLVAQEHCVMCEVSCNFTISLPNTGTHLKMPQLCCSIALRDDSLTFTQHVAEAAKWNLDAVNWIIYTWALKQHIEKCLKKALCWNAIFVSVPISKHTFFFLCCKDAMICKTT